MTRSNNWALYTALRCNKRRELVQPSHEMFVKTLHHWSTAMPGSVTIPMSNQLVSCTISSATLEPHIESPSYRVFFSIFHPSPCKFLIPFKQRKQTFATMQMLPKATQEFSELSISEPLTSEKPLLHETDEPINIKDEDSQ